MTHDIRDYPGDRQLLKVIHISINSATGRITSQAIKAGKK